MNVELFNKKPLSDRHVLPAPEGQLRDQRYCAPQPNEAVAGGDEAGDVSPAHRMAASAEHAAECVAPRIGAASGGVSPDCNGREKWLSDTMMARVCLNMPRIVRYDECILAGRLKGFAVAVVDGKVGVGRTFAGGMFGMLCRGAGVVEGGSAPWNAGEIGAFAGNARNTGSARMGSATHPRAKKETICYADQ